MPETLMDYISLIAGIFTILAAIATLFGVVYAVKSHLSWKGQFKYNKIVEFDTTLNQLGKKLHHALFFYFGHRSSIFSGQESNVQLQEYEAILIIINDLIADLEIKGNELIRLGVDDLAVNIPSPPYFFAVMLGSSVNTMERAKSYEDLKDYYFEVVVVKHEVTFKEINKYLDDLKNKV